MSRNQVVSSHPTWERAQASALDRSQKCAEKFGGVWRFKVRRVRRPMWRDRHSKWQVVFLEHRGTP